jgi:hypothetical protein
MQTPRQNIDPNTPWIALWIAGRNEDDEGYWFIYNRLTRQSHAVANSREAAEIVRQLNNPATCQ